MKRLGILFVAAIPMIGLSAGFQMFRYVDPVTRGVVIKPNPPKEYEWKRTAIEADGTWVLEVGAKKQIEPASLPDNVQVNRPGERAIRTPITPPIPQRPRSEQVDLPDGFGEKFANACFEGLRKSFFDPYSAKMDDYKTLRMDMDGIAVVVMLNGKNRFGAYTGSKPFHCWRHTDGKITVGEGEP